MKKLKRTYKDFGSGSGTTTFENDLFSVTKWNLSNGIRTTLTIRLLFKDIHFEGEIDFKSDIDCISQLTGKEIRAMLKEQSRISYEQGKEDKCKEINKCLNNY